MPNDDAGGRRGGRGERGRNGRQCSLSNPPDEASLVNTPPGGPAFRAGKVIFVGRLFWPEPETWRAPLRNPFAPVEGKGRRDRLERTTENTYERQDSVLRGRARRRNRPRRAAFGHVSLGRDDQDGGRRADVPVKEHHRERRQLEGSHHPCRGCQGGGPRRHA